MNKKETPEKLKNLGALSSDDICRISKELANEVRKVNRRSCSKIKKKSERRDKS